MARCCRSTDVIVKSSNVGTAHIALMIGRDCGSRRS